MNRLALAAVVVSSMVVYAHAADGVAPASTKEQAEAVWAERCNVTVEEWKALSKADQRTKQAEYKKKAAGNLKNMAKFCGMAEGEFKKLSPEERTKKIRQVKAVKAEEAARVRAKRFGMTVEDWKKLSPKEQEAKLGEWKNAHKK